MKIGLCNWDNPNQHFYLSSPSDNSNVMPYVRSHKMPHVVYETEMKIIGRNEELGETIYESVLHAKPVWIEYFEDVNIGIALRALCKLNNDVKDGHPPIAFVVEWDYDSDMPFILFGSADRFYSRFAY